MNLEQCNYCAKRIDNREWVQSSSILITEEHEVYLASEYTVMMSYLPLPDGHGYGNIRSIEPFRSDHMEYVFMYLVDPNTLCQYSGIDDIDGHPIYDNDVVRDRNDNTYVVRRDEVAFYMVNKNRKEILDKSSGLIIIGNIIDNPELNPEEME